MDTTRPSLLQRVRQRDDQTAWREFFDLYNPLIVRFAKSRGLDDDTSADVAQECMKKLSQHMQAFDYERGRGSFKNYLMTLASHEISSRFRRKRPELASSGEWRNFATQDAKLQEDWDTHWLKEHINYCLGNIQSEFSEETMQAFKLYGLEQWPVARVCETLSMTDNQVYLAKSRITRRLRSEMVSLLGAEL